jgi:hypothetical protein
MHASNIDTFNRFAMAFEETVLDDNWARLEPYFAEDVTYLNVGGPDPISEGKDAVIAFLKADVANTDRRFDKRKLVALTPPVVDGERLSRKWRCTYSITNAPDLVVEGEARYLFESGLIKAIEEEATGETMLYIGEWMEKYSDRLHAL